MPDFFKDKVAIVTGASSGIGLCTARLLSERGARVVLAARSKDKLEKLAQELPNSIAVPTDVTDKNSVLNMVQRTLDAFGRIDILINNAGILIYKPIVQSTDEDLRRVMEVNFFGAVACANAVLPAMEKQKSGTIVNISSIAGRIGFPNIGYYCASKFAFTGFSETFRQEVASKGIIVSTVNPGTTETPLNQTILDEARKRGKNILPITPERVARAILNAAEKGKAEVFVPWSTRVLHWLHFFAPRFTEWLAWHFRSAEKY